MKWLLNNCRRHEAELSLLAAGALPETQRTEVAAHLAACAACRAKLAELQGIAGRLATAGQRLPELEAPAALRRRWVTAVRASAPARHREPAAFLPAWLSARRLAWGSITAMWALVLFFRCAAPDAPKPASLAGAPPPSLREVLLALKVEDRHASRRNDAAASSQEKSPQTDALPPRSQRLNSGSTYWEVS